MATKHPRGYIRRMLKWCRVRSDMPEAIQTNGKYADDDILELFAEKSNEVVDDLYDMADSLPIVRFPITLAQDKSVYSLPANYKEFHRLYEIDDNNGLVKWEYLPRSKYNPWGSQVQFEGSQMRLVPTPQSGVDGKTVQFEYVPGGFLMPHQQAVPIWSADNDTGTALVTSTTVKLKSTANTTDYLVGAFDQRPEGFLGMTIRLLGTATDTAPLRSDQTNVAYPWFPVQERIISGYDDHLGTITVETPFDFDPTGDDAGSNPILDDKATWNGEATGITYLVYEIVPSYDPDLLMLIQYATALELARIGSRPDKVDILQDGYDRQKRGVIKRLANSELRVGNAYDTDEADADEGWY